jgi:hypothetical protein
MEAIGDITASAEVSRVEVEGEDFESRIQGGVLVGLTPVSRLKVPKHRHISERWSWRLFLCSLHGNSVVYFRTGMFVQPDRHLPSAE